MRSAVWTRSSASFYSLFGTFRVLRIAKKERVSFVIRVCVGRLEVFIGKA